MGPERGRGRECNRNSASSGTGLQSGTESNRSAAPSRTEQAVDGSSNERRPRQHRELEPKFEVIITRENRSETGVGSGPVAPQIDQKSVYRTSRDASWRPRASQGRLGSVSGAFPAHPGSARWVHKLTPGRQTECPGTPGHDQNWRQVAPRHEKIAFSLRGSFAKHGRIDFSPISVVFRLLREVCEPSEVPRLSAKTRVRPHKRVPINVERISARNHRISSKF